jgi:hypothetical protein
MDAFLTGVGIGMGLIFLPIIVFVVLWFFAVGLALIGEIFNPRPPNEWD